MRYSAAPRLRPWEALQAGRTDASDDTTLMGESHMLCLLPHATSHSAARPSPSLLSLCSLFAFSSGIHEGDTRGAMSVAPPWAIGSVESRFMLADCTAAADDNGMRFFRSSRPMPNRKSASWPVDGKTGAPVGDV